MSKNIKGLLRGKNLLGELEECRNEEEAIALLKRENLWGVVINYPELEELKESYKNSEIEADGILSLSQLDKVAGGEGKSARRQTRRKTNPQKSGNANDANEEKFPGYLEGEEWENSGLIELFEREETEGIFGQERNEEGQEEANRGVKEEVPVKNDDVVEPEQNVEEKQEEQVFVKEEVVEAEDTVVEEIKEEVTEDEASVENDNVVGHEQNVEGEQKDSEEVKVEHKDETLGEEMPKQEGADPIEKVEETDSENEKSVEVVKKSDADTSSGSGDGVEHKEEVKLEAPAEEVSKQEKQVPVVEIKPAEEFAKQVEKGREQASETADESEHFEMKDEEENDDKVDTTAPIQEEILNITNLDVINLPKIDFYQIYNQFSERCQNDFPFYVMQPYNMSKFEQRVYHIALDKIDTIVFSSKLTEDYTYDESTRLLKVKEESHRLMLVSNIEKSLTEIAFGCKNSSWQIIVELLQCKSNISCEKIKEIISVFLKLPKNLQCDIYEKLSYYNFHKILVGGSEEVFVYKDGQLTLPENFSAYDLFFSLGLLQKSRIDFKPIKNLYLQETIFDVGQLKFLDRSEKAAVYELISSASEYIPAERYVSFINSLKGIGQIRLMPNGYKGPFGFNPVSNEIIFVEGFSAIDILHIFIEINSNVVTKDEFNQAKSRELNRLISMKLEKDEKNIQDSLNKIFQLIPDISQYYMLRAFSSIDAIKLGEKNELESNVLTIKNDANSIDVFSFLATECKNIFDVDIPLAQINMKILLDCVESRFIVEKEYPIEEAAEIIVRCCFEAMGCNVSMTFNLLSSMNKIAILSTSELNWNANMCIYDSKGKALFLPTGCKSTQLINIFSQIESIPENGCYVANEGQFFSLEQESREFFIAQIVGKLNFEEGKYFIDNTTSKNLHDIKYETLNENCNTSFESIVKLIVEALDSVTEPSARKLIFNALLDYISQISIGETNGVDFEDHTLHLNYFYQGGTLHEMGHAVDFLFQITKDTNKLSCSAEKSLHSLFSNDSIKNSKEFTDKEYYYQFTPKGGKDLNDEPMCTVIDTINGLAAHLQKSEYSLLSLSSVIHDRRYFEREGAGIEEAFANAFWAYCDPDPTLRNLFECYLKEFYDDCVEIIQNLAKII